MGMGKSEPSLSVLVYIKQLSIAYDARVRTFPVKRELESIYTLPEGMHSEEIHLSLSHTLVLSIKHCAMSVSKLPTRKIGTDAVTAIGWGAMGLSAYYGSTASDEVHLKVNTSFMPWNFP